jgi:hypothetical protein
MDQAVNQFFTAGTAVLALSVVIFTFFIRRIVETAVPSVKKAADENQPAVTYKTQFARWWNQVILYAIPVVVGAGIGLLHVPYLFSVEGIGDSASSRVFFGGVVGWLSSYVYKIIRMTLKKKTGIDIQPSASIMPGAPESLRPDTTAGSDENL